ncbi:MAG: arginase family protein [Clostridia bacterium]
MPQPATLIMVDNGNYNLPKTDQQQDLSSSFNGGKPNSTESYIANSSFNFDLINDIKTKLCIIDSNSAHQISLFLATKHFAEFKQQGVEPQLFVLNFDQHLDYGKEKNARRLPLKSNELINCGNWACFLDEKIDYLAVGVDFIGVGANSVGCDFIPSHISDNLNVYIEPIKDRLRGHKNVYITIDMDVLIGFDRTNWQPGSLRYTELLSILKEILQFCKSNSINIVGADITGMPPIKKTPTPSKIVETYLQNVEEVANTLLDYLK